MGNHPGSFIDRLKHQLTGKRVSSKSRLSTDVVSTTESPVLETFLLVWLDPHVDTSKENVRTQHHLRKVLTCLITFDNVETCESWLKKCCTEEKIIFIVAGAYGQEIVSRIHHLHSIVAIYVYCLHVDRNRDWAKDFVKIRSVTSSTDQLLQELAENQTNLESVEDSKALNIYQREQQVSSLDAKTASFVAYQLLLEILISTDYIPSKGTFEELIHILRQYNSDDDDGSKLIDEFERSYEPKRAVSWLIRDTPLARFVNKALREQDIHMLFALRFLLVDIHTKLIKYQASSMNVFKIQPMLKSDMEILRANPGQLLVINGFLFASNTVPELTSTMINSDQFETVLLDITADCQQGVVPFAFVRKLGKNLTEQADREVLFMCGSMYEVGSLIYENSIWRLHLKLVGENNSTVLFNMKQKLKEDRNLRIVSDLFNQCGQTEKAAIYTQRLSKELPNKRPPVSRNNERLTRSHSRPSLTSTSYVLVNLSEHLTAFASSVLEVLCSETSKSIHIIDDSTAIDFSQWSKSATSIFTTSQSVSSFGPVPKDFKIFLFNNGNANPDQQQFATIDDLICQLADEIIRKYRTDAAEYTRIGDTIQAEEQTKHADLIDHQLRKIQAMPPISNTPMRTLDTFTAPIFIWLTTRSMDNEDVRKSMKETFESYFSSYLIFVNENDFHEHLVTGENPTDLFIIIHSNYHSSIVNGSRDFSHVQHVYRYGTSDAKDDEVIINSDDLCYRLIRDLIDYYGKLGEQYRANQQQKEARHMFLQARNLCHLLAKNCFASA